MKGGCRPHEAIYFYNNSDGKNVKRIINNHLNSDYIIELNEDGYKKIET